MTNFWGSHYPGTSQHLMEMHGSNLYKLSGFPVGEEKYGIRLPEPEYYSGSGFPLFDLPLDRIIDVLVFMDNIQLKTFYEIGTQTDSILNGDMLLHVFRLKFEILYGCPTLLAEHLIKLLKNEWIKNILSVKEEDILRTTNIEKYFFENVLNIFHLGEKLYFRYGIFIVNNSIAIKGGFLEFLTLKKDLSDENLDSLLIMIRPESFNVLKFNTNYKESRKLNLAKLFGFSANFGHISVLEKLDLIFEISTDEASYCYYYLAMINQMIPKIINKIEIVKYMFHLFLKNNHWNSLSNSIFPFDKILIRLGDVSFFEYCVHEYSLSKSHFPFEPMMEEFVENRRHNKDLFKCFLVKYPPTEVQLRWALTFFGKTEYFTQRDDYYVNICEDLLLEFSSSSQYDGVFNIFYNDID